MEHYAGIDVSLELSSVCVVDAQGKIVKEAKVASEPEAVVAFFEALGFAVKRIGFEAGPLSHWLHAGLKEAGFETVLLETRHVKAVYSLNADRRQTGKHSVTSRLTGFDPYETRCELVALALLSRHIGFASLNCELSQMQVFINESTTVLNLSKHRVIGVAKFASLDLGESC
jgi:hypothetical protein